MNVFRTFGLALAASTLCACSANHNAIYRHDTLNPDQSAIITVDAKQRAILVGDHRTTEEHGGKRIQTDIHRFCSEPSPDVFSVVAQALSAGGSFGKSADPRTIQLALTAAFSSSEQGSTIPRTQTVNMLRELMFRTCERYLNGGIGELELPIQAARDQRLMVSILAIESLTGAVTPRPVVIAAGASASGGASGAEAAVRLDDAYKDLQAKTAAQQSRQNEYNAITTDKKHCEQIAEAVAGKEEDKLPQELKDKRANCEAATSALAGARKATAASASHYASLMDTATIGGVPVATVATPMTPKADGGLDRARSDPIEKVAASVERIVLANINQDEFAFLCMKVLDPNASRKLDAVLLSDDTGIKETCADYINSQIEKSIAINSMIALGVAPDSAQFEEKKNALFEKFWAKVSTDGQTANAIEVAKMRKQYSWWPACFSDSGSKVDYATCFNKVSSAKKKRLSR